MNELTIAILRRPFRLVALVSACPTQIAAPRYGDPLIVDPYVELALPLEEVTDLNRDCLRELELSWQRLSHVTVLDEAIAVDIRQVLAMTIPDDVHSSIEPWRPPVLPKLPRATAQWHSLWSSFIGFLGVLKATTPFPMRGFWGSRVGFSRKAAARPVGEFLFRSAL